MRDFNLETDAIVIPRARYEDLIKGETTLEILCAMIEKIRPYQYEDLKVIAGDYMEAREDK